MPKKSLEVKFSDQDMTPTDDPLSRVSEWLKMAEDANILNANAMSLSTVDAENCPDNRFVLLKGIDEKGLTFYSDYRGPKV